VPIVAVVAATAAGGCAELGVIGDGTTVSWGPPNRGVLIDGQLLPREGEGFWVPPRWAARHTQWGTDELLDVIAHVGRAVAATHPGSRLAVGDLSPAGGGPSAWHRSHQSGRDVDLVLFCTDLEGRPVEEPRMRHFDDSGQTVDGEPRLRLDADRTWTVVAALIEAPGPGVANIFLYAPLEDLVLDHARELGVSEDLLDRAAQVMSQPGDSAPHDDHMHVRIFCSPSDPGCSDYARLTPAKKQRPAPGREVAERVAARPVVGSLLRVTGRW